MSETLVDLSKALIASVLDIPGAFDAPEISRVTPEAVSPGLSLVWRNMRDLYKQDNLSVTSLVASLNDPTLDIFYFNRLRDQYRDVSLNDLRGIAEALERHTNRVQLKDLAGWVATESLSDKHPRDVARAAINKFTPIALQSSHDIIPLSDVLGEVYDEINERSKNPGEVWGIPYPFKKLNLATGGKQKGELILLAGEPKVGKSWWTLQDALHTAKQGIPVAVFSLEMSRKQVVRRLLKLEGLDGTRSRTGYMTPDDWEILSAAIATLDNLPLYIDDRPMGLNDIRPALVRLKAECGIEQFILDYSLRVLNSGKDEIEKTNNVALECKTVVNDLDVAGVLIASVNKPGMDTTNVTKANVRGSGQQLHEADVIYMLTKFTPGKNDMGIMPADYDQFVTLHVAAGRELEKHVPGGYIHYRRKNSPVFTEHEA